jgi:hypothetical protein
VARGDLIPVNGGLMCVPFNNQFFLVIIVLGIGIPDSVKAQFIYSKHYHLDFLRSDGSACHE